MALGAFSPQKRAGVSPPAEVAAEAHARLGDRETMLLVHRQMFMLAGPSSELDDLVQSALEQLLLARFEGRSSFKTFCHAVCYRVWSKHLRSRYRFFARFAVLDSPPDVADEQMNAESSLEERERMTRLYAALDRITPKRRAVIAMFDLGGMSTAEIAGIVDAPEVTVRTRLRDARAQLAKLLKDDPYFGSRGAPSTHESGEVERGSD